MSKNLENVIKVSEWLFYWLFRTRSRRTQKSIRSLAYTVCSETTNNYMHIQHYIKFNTYTYRTKTDWVVSKTLHVITFTFLTFLTFFSKSKKWLLRFLLCCIRFLEQCNRLFELTSYILKRPNTQHCLQLKMVLVKCCDISNELRPLEVAEPWLDCLLQEYFNQVTFGQDQCEERENAAYGPIYLQIQCSDPGEGMTAISSTSDFLVLLCILNGKQVLADALVICHTGATYFCL